MAYYLIPPEGNSPSVAPSLGRVKRGVGTSASAVNGATNGATKAPYPYHTDAEPNNPTVIPRDTLGKFHFTFLIRHPRSSIPSYYRCTVPPLDEVTGFYDFMPSEAGYEELRRLFDYLRSIGQTGPKVAGQFSDDHATANGTTNGITNGITNGVTNGITNGVTNGITNEAINGNINGASNGIAKGTANGTANGSIDGTAYGDMSVTTNGTTNGFKGEVEVCVVDADDLLDNPQGIVEAYCNSVGIEYTPDMLTWDTEEDGRQAKDAFEKWPGFHDDAMNSTDLKPRLHKKKVKTARDEDAEWAEKFGEKGAKVIRETVDASMEDYEYLKQFAIKA
ncbi:MAG: hypothetical protein Q9183_004879 [Haloplaca sp. 2 TL-2023]